MAWWNGQKQEQQNLQNEVAQLRAEMVAIKNDAEISIRDSQAFKEMFLGGGQGVKTVINSDSAMRCSAVFACVRLIAGAIASAPIRIYREDANGVRERAPRHPYATLLASRPNDAVTASTFWKTMAANKVLNGNAYAPIIRSPLGKPLAMIPIHPTRVEPYQAWELGLHTKLGVGKYRLYYMVTWDDGTCNLIDQDDMLHIPNVGWNGKQGLSTIRAGAQAMGLSLAAEESASKLFDNGLVSQVALTYPAKLSGEAQDRLRDHMMSRHGGAENHHKPLILTEGGDVKTMAMNAGDAQLLESRQYSVIDIARFFGVPPVMIGENTKTTSFGSGVEQMKMWFMSFSMTDHLTDFEQEIQRKLFRNSDFVVEFDESELTRGDTKTRGDYYRIARGSSQEPGIMTINEIRLAEGLPPKPGGDKLYVPQVNTGNKPKPEEEKNAEKQTDATVPSESESETGGTED